MQPAYSDSNFKMKGERGSIFRGHNILNPLLLTMKTNRRSISCNHNILNPYPYGGGGSIFHGHNILNPGSLYRSHNIMNPGFNISQRYFEPGFKISRGSKHYMTPVFRMRPYKLRSLVAVDVGKIKIPPCSKALSAEHRPKFAAQSLVMVTAAG